MNYICMRCGRIETPVDPITGECWACAAKREYEENDACAKCYVNMRDHEHPKKLCKECQIEEGEV